MRPFDVQLAAGVAMYRGVLVELATGEGKTLTAAFPAFLYGLAGKGVHVATVNDYLAKRDAELLSPVCRLLGQTTGVLQMQMDENLRAEAYRADITYGTASEFGFDFLRDRLKYAVLVRLEGRRQSPIRSARSTRPLVLPDRRSRQHLCR
jgi:preprotein translocase subunit SecA